MASKASLLVKQFRHREVMKFASLTRSNPTPTPAAAGASAADATVAAPSTSRTPPATTALKIPNPFLPHKNPDTGRWAPPRYSLRRQAELVKDARASQLVHLLPPGPKLSLKELADAIALQQARATDAVGPKKHGPKSDWKGLWKQEIIWDGEVKEKKVAGADIGNKLYAGKWRMFKGHKWERTREARLKKREYLMKNMKDRIDRFKSVSAVLSHAHLSLLTNSRLCRHIAANGQVPSPDQRLLASPSCHSRYPHPLYCSPRAISSSTRPRNYHTTYCTCFVRFR